MLPTTASEYFGRMVDEYDSLIHRAVPRYDEMLDRLIDYLPRAGAIDILELGCGTGNLSLQLAARFPSARLTLVDASPEMLQVTRERLASADPSALRRVSFLERRFEDLGGENSYDLIVSSISLHHVKDKAAMYRGLFKATREGGTLRFCDQLRGGTDEIHEKNWKRWLEFCRSAEHCSEAEVQSLLDHAEAHDHYTPLTEHFDLLRAAGYSSLDCVWRNWIWGIIVADRS